MKTPLSFAALLALALSFIPGVAAQGIYTAGHGDFGVSYTPGDTTFGLQWGIDQGAIVDGQPLQAHTEFSEDALVAFTTATVATPGSSATWLGVPGGSTVYRLGSDTYPPNLGFNTSGAGPDLDWLDSTMYITLASWSGPGEVALRNGSSSSSQTIFSTYSPSSTLDNNIWDFDMGVGHVHLVWYFTQPGYYELTFDWSGTYIGGIDPLDVSGTGTFGIYAGVIPEPASCAGMAGTAALGLVLWRRRWKK